MLIKAMIIILLLAFGGLFFVKGPTGEPFLTVDDFTPSMPEAEKVMTPTKVYKWQDENGVWQFSNQPRDENQGEVMELDGNINTMPAVDTAILRTNSDSSSGGGGMSNLPSGLTTVSGDNVQNMMDTVNNLQQTVDDRKAATDKVVNPGKN